MIGAVMIRWLALIAQIENSVMYSTRVIFENRP